MVIEVLNCIIIIFQVWGVDRYNCDVKWTCPQADGDKSAWDWTAAHDSVHNVPVNKKSNAPCLCLSSLPLKYNLWPSSVDVSPKFFFVLLRWSFFTFKVFLLYSCTLQRPKMFQWYLLISYDNSSSLPAIHKVILTFQVPMVILYLTSTLIVDTPVAYF